MRNFMLIDFRHGVGNISFEKNRLFSKVVLLFTKITGNFKKLCLAVELVIKFRTSLLAGKEGTWRSGNTD